MMFLWNVAKSQPKFMTRNVNADISRTRTSRVRKYVSGARPLALSFSHPEDGGRGE